MMVTEITETITFAGVIIAMILLPAIILFLAGLPLWIIIGAFVLIYGMMFNKKKRK